MSSRRPRVIRNKGAIAAARARRVPPPGERLAFQVDPWTRRLVRPLLVAALSTAVGINVLVIIQIVNPEQPWLSVAWLCFFAALEGAYTATWLNNPASRGVDRGVYRVTEVVFLLVLARVVSWLLFGDGLPSPDEMRVFLAAPLSFFMTGGFITTSVVTLFCWFLSVTFSGIFTQLDVSVDEVQHYTLSQPEQKAQADNRPIQVARDKLQDQYLQLWLFMGMLMVALAALSTYEVRSLAAVTNPFEITRLGLRPAVLFALLLYFLVGLWLLSHARLLRLNARWLMDGVGKDATLERAWQRGSLVILLVIAFAAAFLPIGSTLGISRILGMILNGIFYVVGLIYSLLGYLFAALLSGVVGDQEQTIVPTPQPMPSLPVPPAAAPAPPNPTLAFLISSAFWALLIALVIAALLFFLRERGYKLEWQQVRVAWASFTGKARALWQRWRGRARAAGLQWRERLRGSDQPTNAPAASASGLRFLRRSLLSPRDQIRYYYLSTVRRAGERGVPRAGNETPLEYVHDLKQNWPDAGADLDELTHAFLEARYSPQPLDKTAVGRVKTHWKRVRDRLRGRSGH